MQKNFMFCGFLPIIPFVLQEKIFLLHKKPIPARACAAKGAKNRGREPRRGWIRPAPCYSSRNKMPRVLGPQWQEIVQLARVT